MGLAVFLLWPQTQPWNLWTLLTIQTKFEVVCVNRLWTLLKFQISQVDSNDKSNSTKNVKSDFGTPCLSTNVFKLLTFSSFCVSELYVRYEGWAVWLWRTTRFLVHQFFSAAPNWLTPDQINHIVKHSVRQSFYGSLPWRNVSLWCNITHVVIN